MNLKHSLLAVTLLSISTGAMAQDKIFKSNGEVIEARIKNIGTRQIIYKRTDNQAGPDYFIPKDEVDKVKYENGDEENISGNGATVSKKHNDKEARDDKPMTAYKSNIIAFAPIQFTESGIAGFSFSYEKAIDKKGIVAFYVPLIAEFNTQTNYDYYGMKTTHTDGMYYLMPGIKLYPTGSFGTAKYAIGPSLVLATGNKTQTNNNYGGYYGYSSYTTDSHTLLGMIVNQSVNINPTKHLYLGAELGLGFTYVNTLGGVNNGTEFLTQFAFKLGYRF